MIYTHQYVDLDAVASVWAVRKFKPYQAQVKFVPANFDGSEMENSDVAVDIIAGGKGIKGDAEGNDYVGSAFSKIVQSFASSEEIEALKPIILYVDLQDNTGSAVKALVADRDDRDGVETLEANSLTAVFNAVKAILKNDGAVTDYMSTVFEGLLESGLSRMRCKKEAEKVEIPYSSVALVRDPKEPGLNAWIFSNNDWIDAIVYVDGNNLGVTRRNTCDVRMDDESIKKIVREAGEESEWFFHPSGFLAAHGTHKAPAENMSKINPKQLAAAVSDLICY